MKKLGYVLFFLLIGCLMPVAIWVAAGAAFLRNRTPAKPAHQVVSEA